jgi:hypothetical protein
MPQLRASVDWIGGLETPDIVGRSPLSHFPAGDGALAAELAAIDAVLARSEAAIAEVRSAGRRAEREKDPLVYDLDWDEE